MGRLHSVPSKVNSSLDVPTKAATERPATPVETAPYTPTHATEVLVVQLEVSQAAPARAAVAVTSSAPKAVPASVRGTATEGRLYVEPEWLIAGAGGCTHNGHCDIGWR